MYEKHNKHLFSPEEEYFSKRISTTNNITELNCKVILLVS